MIQTVTEAHRQADTHTDKHTHTYRNRHIHRHLQTLAARQSHVLQANGTHENICMFVLCCPVLSSSLARLPHAPRSAILRLSLGTQKMASGQVELTTYRPGG